MGELGEQALLDLLESRADESLYEDDDVCRLAQLAGALAEDLPHVNLAFQDDEPRAIALDMLDPECDDLPWRLDGEEVELRRRASMPPPGVGRLRNSLDRPQSGPGQLCTAEAAYSNPTSLSEALLSWECPNDKQLSGPSSWSGGMWEPSSSATQVQSRDTQDLWTASPAESTRDEDNQIKKAWETFAEDSLTKPASPWKSQPVRWSFGPDKLSNQDVEHSWDNSSAKSPSLPRNFCSSGDEDILKNSVDVGLQQSSENGFLRLLNLPESGQNQLDSGIGPEDIVLTENMNSEVFSESERPYGSLPKESCPRPNSTENINEFNEMSSRTSETKNECTDPHPFIPGKRKDATNSSDTQDNIVLQDRTLELSSVCATSEGQERGYSCASDDGNAQNLSHSDSNRHVVYGIPDTSETWEWFSERQRSEPILEEVTVGEEEVHSSRPDPGPDLICALAIEPAVSLNHEEEQPRGNALEAPQSGADQDAASGEEDDDIDWSWVAALLDMRGEEDADSMKNQQEQQQDAEPPPAPRRPSSSSWLRASMRRLRPLRLSDPVPTAPPPEPTAPPPPPPDTPLSPLATPETVVEILSAASTPVRSVSQPPPNGRPRSAPVSYTRARDFPRRYSNYSVQQQPIQVVSPPPPVPPPRQEHHEEEEEEEEDDLEEEDVSSSSEDANNRRCNNTEDSDMSGHSPLGTWPHNLSSVLASLGCTLGLFNINRFAFLSVQYGANFIVQFLFLTLVMGIPLYTLHSCLGQCLNSGVMDMWKISPIFQGIGIALLVSQALVGIYSIVGVSWMFIYFRDSFITRQERYRWAEPFEFYRQDSYAAMNGSWKLEETVPDYLNGVVLQRHNLATPDSSFGHLKFQVTFNLAVVWMIVFVCLSKGLKSYGKVVYVFALLPVFGMLILCTKLLGLTPTTTTHQVFPQTVWSEFFLNTKCWVAAATETFFTWGLLGVAMMQITSHNRNKHLLNRDTSLVIVLTIAVLLLAAFLANTCVSLLQSNGFYYVPSSFEQMSTYQFLAPTSEPLQPALASTPVRYLAHTTFILGEKVALHGVDTRHQSGYQVLRFATELFPATLALLGIDTVSPFWSVLFYFVLILFGIAQQLAIWHSVITGIMAINASILKSWETTITFFSCACGFVLGLPMTTELGIFVVYFLDYSIGGAWWIMVLYLLEIVVVFVVRGRPYSGETVVATLFRREATGCLQTWAAPMLVFMWNVFLPIALVVLCITVFRSGQFRELYDWRHLTYNYWPVWTRELGCLLQLAPIMAVLMVCIIQTCRYLSDGPPDIFDRIQLLYRPSLGPYRPRIEVPVHTTSTPPASAATANPTPVADTVVSSAEDPPPKYTPPPSYTTATGARIAKLLRRSFRRSMRRLAGTLSDGREDLQQQQQSPPPDYATVLVEMNQGAAVSAMPATVARSSTMTAADVAHLLRSSLRRTLRQGDGTTGGERLVDGAAPIHRDSKIDNTSSM